ncbi:MAG: FumA C-terminus/TtdB family hydratase beta subunit [Defluviitaleaceae bacterium]|nr:FumA C-terminus/TtdB family hydratase beta subunit [Defluviitaleaceae bacterium]
MKEISTPLTDDIIKSLKVGETVYLTGSIYTARDAAHKRLCEMLEKGEPMPIQFEGQIVFYAGPSPTPPGAVIGSIGPTTAVRMDKYSPILIEKGLKAMIGKGIRGEEVKKAVIDHTGVYFAQPGGIAALMSKCVTSLEIVAFEDLGTEAIRKLTVEKMPLIVALDCYGGDVYNRQL